jgi:hypothetical protein
VTGAWACRPLLAELDLWRRHGLSARFWLRDDDAIEPSAALERLARLSERFSAPVLLAVIPMLAEKELAAFQRSAPSLLPCQHGAWHRSHAAPGEKKAEFGAGRDIESALAEIAEGRERLNSLFGPASLAVFVPPWNRIGLEIAARLPGLGFSGLSCFRGFALGEDDGPALANTHLDIIDWHGGRIGRDAAGLADELARLLAGERQSPAGPGTFAGILLHHRDHDETAWAGLERLLEIIAGHPAAGLVDPRRLFPGEAGFRS